MIFIANRKMIPEKKRWVGDAVDVVVTGLSAFLQAG